MIQWKLPETPQVAQARVALARAALVHRPEHLPVWIALGDALRDAHDLPGTVAHWSAAVRRFPEEPRLGVKLAAAQIRFGQFETALAGLESLGGAEADDAAPLLLAALVRLGRWDAAAVAATRVPLTQLSVGLLIQRLAHALKDDPATLLAETDAMLDAFPGVASVLYYRARSLAMLGRTAESRATIGFDSLITVEELRVPGWPVDATFHAVLRAEIVANDTLRPDPRGKSTLGGLQTSALIRTGNTATPALCDAIRGAVDRYAAALEGDHWLVRGRPRAARLDAWAVVYDDDGAQTPHRHPAGWVSGVFYVGGAEGAEGAGALLLGVVDEGVDTVGGGTEIAPKPGRLVIFPSATTHATMPSKAGAQRISVAFDVIPATD